MPRRPYIGVMASNTDQEISDEELVRRISEGNHGAFAQLVERHSKLFFSAAYRMLNNVEEAEDTVQDAYVKLWQQPDRFDPSKGVKFTTWFYRVVTNLAIDQTRKRKPQVKSEVLDVMADKAPLADEQLSEQDEQTALEEAIDRLPERQKAALNLCFYEGLSNKEAAEVLDVGVKALESLLMRAKKALKEDLGGQGLLDNTAERKTG